MICAIYFEEVVKDMKTVAIVGQSRSGKTGLIRQLIPELKNRGASVCVIKHCAHGFILDSEGKDSWQFSAAGADGVGMVGPDELALIIKEKVAADLRQKASRYFPRADLVVLEAGPGIRGFKKIEVLRKDFADKPASAPEDLLAIISEEGSGSAVPCFHPGQIKELVDFLEQAPGLEDSSVFLEVDGEAFSLNPSVAMMFENILMEIVRAVKGPANPRNILFSLQRRNPKNEKL